MTLHYHLLLFELLPLFHCLTRIRLSALFGILFFLFHAFLWFFRLIASMVNFFLSKFRNLHRWIVQNIILLLLFRSLMVVLIVFVHDLVVVLSRVIFVLEINYHLGF